MDVKFPPNMHKWVIIIIYCFVSERQSFRLKQGQKCQFNYNRLVNEKWPNDVSRTQTLKPQRKPSHGRLVTCKIREALGEMKLMI